MIRALIRKHRVDLTWVAIALGCVWLAWLYPVLADPRHYFQGDTQNAYYGWWYQLGTSLLHGHWPMIDAQAGSAGNPLAEGQEGLYNPLLWLIGIGAAVAPQLVVYTTFVKLAVAGIGVVGVYLLARGYGVRPGLAAVAAAAAQLGGFTLSADAPRWFSGQLVVALLPWVWWAVRRALAGGSPWPMLVSAYLLVTCGYVFGTMYLGLVVAGLLLEALLTRHWVGVRRLLLFGVYVALLCITIYIPGILTSPVTWRNKWEFSTGNGFLAMDPLTLLLMGHPTTVPASVGGLADPVTGIDQVTFTYVAWFLPLVFWVVFARFRTEWRSLVSLVVPFALTCLWTVLPYYMGPIRMPGRAMSMVTLTGVLLVVVLLDRALDRSAAGRPSTRRVVLSLAWVGGAAAVTALQRPSTWWFQALAGLVVAGCVVAAFVAAPQRRRLAGVMLAASVGIAVLQLTVQPGSSDGNTGSPGELSAYDDLLPGAQGDVFVIGTSRALLARHPELNQSVLGGSLWELTGRPVHTGYTTLGYRNYNFRFCTKFNGDTCAGALDTMLQTEPTTGLRWVDLHSISTLVLVELPDSKTAKPPAGWHVANDDGHIVTWVRDDPLPTAGGVVWSSPGTAVHQVSQSATTTTFVVDQVPAHGGSVVLSRIAWPGYTVDGATFGNRVGGHLIRVRLTPGSVRSTVTVQFRPPGWHPEVVALVVALLLAAAWIATSAIGARRRRSGEPTEPAEPDDAPQPEDLETSSP